MLCLFVICCCGAESENSSDGVCRAAVNTGDYQAALSACTLQWPMIVEKKNQKIVVDYYFSMIDLYYHLGKQEEEADYLNKIASHPSFNSDMVVKYEFYRTKGRQILRQGDYDSSVEYFNLALSLAIDQGNLVWMSKSYNNVGAAYRLSNKYQQALTYYQKSLELKNKLGDLYLIATTQSNIGVVYTHLEEHKRAVNFYQLALDNLIKYSQIEDNPKVKKMITHMYQDIGLAYLRVDDIVKARKYKQLILNHFKEIVTDRDQTLALMNVAILDMSEGLYIAAITRLNQAIEMSAESIYEHSSEMYFNLALAYQKNDQANLAIETAEQGLAMIAKLKNDEVKMNLHYTLSQLYLPLNKDLAIEHMLVYQADREQFLHNKFDESVKTKQHKIEMMLKEKYIIDEKYNNLLKSSEIKNLQQSVVVFTLLLLGAIGVVFFLLFKRKKERQQLLDSIKSHQQQVLLLNDKQSSRDADHSQVFKKLLVETMVLLVEIWEKHTGTNRVDLAEKSEAWTISVDNGTLRTRSLDKYMSIRTIPKFPRWKNVIKTCHFVLSDEALSTDDRSLVNEKLDNVMQLIKKKSLE